MPAKIEKTGNDAINLMSPIFSNEDTAREFLESKRWPNGAECPRCDCKTVYKLEPKPESLRPVRPGVYKCKGCPETVHRSDRHDFRRIEITAPQMARCDFFDVLG